MASKKDTLSIFLIITHKLLSTDASKKTQRINLSKRIISTIINKPQFVSQLDTSANCNYHKLCQRCIDLSQHNDHQIHLFAKLLLQKIINNNDTLKNTMIQAIFASYKNIMPISLLPSNDISEQTIISKLRTIIVMLDELYLTLLSHPSLQCTYSHQMQSFKNSFLKLIHKLCPPQKNEKMFESVPYKLPSIAVQTILINFWCKHLEYMPNSVSFRTMYLLRWVCVLPSDINENVMNKLLNIMVINFDNHDTSDHSESVLLLFGILGFLGGSTISICDNHNPSILLYKILERIPISVAVNLNRNFGQIIKSISIGTLSLIYQSILQFPESKEIKQWKFCFEQNLKKHNYIIPYLQQTNGFGSAKRLSLTDKCGLTNTNWTTCYINSIIQTLFISDQFRETLLSFTALKYSQNSEKQSTFPLQKHEWNKMHFVMNELQTILRSLKQKRKIVSTKRFVNLLPLPWSAPQQQDCHQFAKYILDQLCELIKHSNFAGNKLDPFGFDGMQCGHTKCNNCGIISKKHDIFNELSLSIDGNSGDINGLINKYFEIEQLCGDNKYKCDKCKKYTESQRYFKITQAPKNLIVCLKRMEWKADQNRILKNSKFINCPLTVSLPINCNKNIEKIEEKDDCKMGKEVTYLLYGAVIHSGTSSECGHYYAIGRHTNDAVSAYDKEEKTDNNKWFKFNDTNVTTASYQKLCKSNEYYGSCDVPYLLFYKKVNQNEMKMNDVKNKQETKVGEKIEVKN